MRCLTLKRLQESDGRTRNKHSTKNATTIFPSDFQRRIIVFLMKNARSNRSFLRPTITIWSPNSSRCDIMGVKIWHPSNICRWYSNSRLLTHVLSNLTTRPEHSFEIVSCLYDWLLVSRPTIRLCILFKVGHAIGWINHDIVVGLCSELRMRLYPSRIW